MSEVVACKHCLADDTKGSVSLHIVSKVVAERRDVTAWALASVLAVPTSQQCKQERNASQFASPTPVMPRKYTY